MVSPRVQGLGFRAESGLTVGLGAFGLEFIAWSLGFSKGLGFGIWG